LLVERVKRNGKLFKPDSESVLEVGDRVALVGYPSNHARSGEGFTEEALAGEVFDPDLLVPDG
jgi:putative transport protein